MLLSNYILAINLMLSIATKFTTSGKFDDFYTEQLNKIKLTEDSLLQ
jgi:hypothetical protein